MRSDTSRRLFVSCQSAAEAGAQCITVYDLVTDKIDDLTQYAQMLERDAMLDPKTVLGALYSVRNAKEYFMSLSNMTVTVKEEVVRIFDASVISEKALRSFRDSQLGKFGDLGQSSVRKAQRSVNASLRAVYRWLWWLSDTGRADAFLIGGYPCRIPSARAGRVVDQYGTVRRRLADEESAPLCFRRVGANARHKPPGFVPDEKLRLDLQAYFSNNFESRYIVERNKLFLSILNTMGLRRESVNSLRINQFRRHDISASEEYYAVQPTNQKNNYEDWYQMPVWLAFAVCAFIEGERAEAIKQRGWSDSVTKGAIFLSYRSGRPILDRSLTKIFSDAMRLLGGPKRAAIHSWRHKYVGEAIDEEIAYRVDRGLDTTVQSIQAAVSLEVGHKNPGSLHGYVVSQLSRKRNQRST